MDAKPAEPDVAELNNKQKPESQERVDEPISDDASMDEEKGNPDSSNNNTEELNSSSKSEQAETIKCLDEQHDNKDDNDTKVEEKVDDKQDDEVPDRQLRNSIKIDKPVEEETSPSADDEDKKLLPEEKQSETPKERKRRYKNFSSSPTKTTSDEVVVKSKRKRLQSDKFCWRCHKESVEMQCSACPRSWHRKCIGGAPMDSVENWICGECAAILKAENVESRSVTMAHVTVDQLCMMLKHVVERMRDYPGSEPFWKAVDINEVNNYLDYVVKPMDLSLLESNVRSKLYGSTDAFMADAKWIQHNCIVFNTCGGVYADTLKLTNVAKQMIKLARQEVSEMEACPDCYAHGRNLPRPMQSWFIEPCQRPHTLVWARLKGFPFWPAKAMPRLNGQGYVDVRFFGQHDRAWVSPKEMFLYSREPPTLSRKRRLDLDNCVKEIERHCQKLAMVFGEFTFAPPKIQYNPQDADQIKLLLPHYDPSQPASKLMGAAMRKRSIANKKGSPGKKKSESLTEEEAQQPKKMKTDDSEEVKSSEEDKDKRRNGFFSEKAPAEGKPNQHPKKLSAILPSRISKRRFTNSQQKSTPERQLVRAKDPLEVKKSPAKVVPPITIVKKGETAPVLSSPKVVPQQQQMKYFLVLNNDTNAGQGSAKSSAMVVKSPAKSPATAVKTAAVKSSANTIKGNVTLVKNSAVLMKNSVTMVKNPATSVKSPATAVKSSATTVKNPAAALKSPAATLKSTATSAKSPATSMKSLATSVKSPTKPVTPAPVIKQEPKSTSPSSPSPDDSKKEGKARKSFAKKIPALPQKERASGSFPAQPMVVIPNFQPESRVSYEMPPAEAGPLCASINKESQELARRVAQFLEESLKDIAQNHLVLHDNSTNSYRASIHTLQMKIEKLKWLHQEEITEIKHNYERKIKEMQSSLEAEAQRILEESQKITEQLKKNIEETKKKTWCAECGREAKLYCCWNTAYCDFPCQQAHWSVHMHSCTQTAFQTTIEAEHSPEQIMPNLVVKNCISSV